MLHFHTPIIPSGEGCKQLLIACHLRRVNAAVFCREESSSPESVASVLLYSPHLPPCVLSNSWWQWARHSRRWAALGTLILPFPPHLAPAYIFPCLLSVCCLLTHFNPCLSRRRVASVFGKDDLVLTLPFSVLLPCWPLSCLPYLLGCYLQFLINIRKKDYSN